MYEAEYMPGLVEHFLAGTLQQGPLPCCRGPGYRSQPAQRHDACATPGHRMAVHEVESRRHKVIFGDTYAQRVVPSAPGQEA